MVEPAGDQPLTNCLAPIRTTHFWMEPLGFVEDQFQFDLQRLSLHRSLLASASHSLLASDHLGHQTLFVLHNGHEAVHIPVKDIGVEKLCINFSFKMH